MKKWLFLGLLMWGLAVWWGMGVGQTLAEGACGSGQTCYGSRNLTAWFCNGTGSSYCLDWYGSCVNIPGQDCDPGLDDADQCGDVHGNAPDCVKVCVQWSSGSGSGCDPDTFNAGCDTDGANYCQVEETVRQCSSSTSGCNETYETGSYGCCGPGGGGGGGGGGTHAECQSQSCVSVSGAGADECSDDSDCAPPPAVTHLECQSNACVVVAGSGADQCAVDPDCVTTYTVSGTVYLDNSGTCSDISTPLLPGAGSAVTSTGLPDAAVGGGGAYSMGGVLGGTRVFSLAYTDPQYVCSCPSGCSESLNVAGNSVVNYFVTNVQGDWWQTRGGDVGANNGSISTNIPGTCTGACKPYLSLYDSLLTADSSGVVWMNSLTGNFGTAGSDISEGTDYLAANASVRTLSRREGYDYFYRLFEMGLNPAEDTILSDNEVNIAKPDTTLQPPANGRAYFVRTGGYVAWLAVLHCRQLAE